MFIGDVAESMNISGHDTRAAVPLMFIGDMAIDEHKMI
jgi:hypothetical protein